MRKVSRNLPVLAALVLAGALAGCNDSGNVGGGYVAGDTDFVSADPGGSYGRGGVDTGAADGGAGAPSQEDGNGQTPERTVEEADIVRVEGDLLYVLNTYRGLQVVDLSNPDDPQLLGMTGIYGRPVEMYVRGDRAYVVVSNYYNYWMAEDVAADGGVASFRGSQIRVLDISNPADPTFVSAFDVPGDITDTRIVGDVLYAVSNHYAWYYDSAQSTEEGTWIVSIDIADPQDIHQVDQVVFPRSGWDNHVHVTPNAIYVASSGYQWDGQTGTYQTRIKYVDISDPAGEIVLGGETFVPGFVRDRWMLDEYEGVFRVVSAPDWSGSPPEVRTFQMGPGGTFQNLGHLALQLPQPESITAVRFDGTKAYVVTYERVDPLFIVDLSDPAAPRQRGQVTMPGWLDHIVTRGDRLVALGHDDASATWQMAVSLFDVSDLDAPALLDRVSFGENWGWVPDERDNFDKVFKVLDDLGLVMIPFYSYGFDDTTGYWHHTGGVQLVDFSRDDLVLRGLVDHAGWVKRALPFGDRILTVSDERMQTVDATDRDHPVITGDVELARNVVDFVTMGNVGVQLVGDWYRGDTRLVVVPMSDPDLGEPLAEIPVTAPYGKMFVNGDLIYLVSQDWRTGNSEVRVVDFSTPTAPVVTGSLTLPEQVSYWGWNYGWWGGDELAQVGGSTLVFHTYRAWYRGYDCGSCGDEIYDRLYVVDLSNPQAPALASTLVLRDEDWVYGIKARGNTLFFTHYEWDGQNADGRSVVRYYLDRYDLSNPARPVRLNKVNVPGYVVDLSEDGSRVFTLDYAYDADGSVQQSFNALRLLGRVASLEGRLTLDGWVGNIQFADGLAWLTTQRSYEDADHNWRNELKLLAIDATASRNLRIAGQVTLPDQYGWLRTVEGGRAFLDLGWMGGMLIYDVSDPADIQLAWFFRHMGWVNSVYTQGNTAYFAMGYYGLQQVGLSAQ